MNETKKVPALIAGFACRIDVIRAEVLSLIRGAVAEHQVIGTFYKNLGEHYSHDQEPEEYDSSPIVVTHNTDFRSYGGYEAATVYELFLDGQGRLLCTLNGEAGEDFDEPLEHIQTEGLLCIVEWLVEYGFIADDPWRCEVCDQTWHEELYVLAEFPDDTSYFEENDIGYPSFGSEDNGARYVPEYDYIRHFQKYPAGNAYYKPLRWPESQPYLFPDEPNESIDALNEPVQDEKGIADFGEQAVWVSLCHLKI